MGKGNPYQGHINASGFGEKLRQGDPKAWGILLEYARKQVAHAARSRPLPRDLDYEATVEEYAGEACALIVEKLDEFRQAGPLSAYVDKLIHTAIADRNLKNLLGAMTRFLEAAGKLPPSHRGELRRIIRQRPAIECEMLLACMNGEPLALTDPRRRRLWYDARRGLLYDPDFERLCYVLVRQGNRQAKTVQIWHEALQGPASSSASCKEGDSEAHKERALADRFVAPDLTPLEELVRRDDRQTLLECLEALRQKSENHYQAIIRKFYNDDSYAQIVATLGGSSEASARQWVSRGLGNLRDCLTHKQII